MIKKIQYSDNADIHFRRYGYSDPTEQEAIVE